MLVNRIKSQQVRYASRNTISSLASRNKYYHIIKTSLSRPSEFQYITFKSWSPAYISQNSFNKNKSLTDQRKLKPLPPLTCKLINSSVSDSEFTKPSAEKIPAFKNWKGFQSCDTNPDDSKTYIFDKLDSDTVEAKNDVTHAKTDQHDYKLNFKKICKPCQEQQSPSLDSKPCGCSCIGRDCQCNCGLPEYLLSPYYYVTLALLSFGAGITLGSWYQNKYKKPFLHDAMSHFEADIKKDGQKACDIERELLELNEDSSEFEELLEELQSLEEKARLHEITIEEFIRNLEKLKKRCHHLSYGVLNVQSDKECKNKKKQANGLP